MATPNVETKIWLALRTRLAGLTLSPAATVLWPGEDASIPSGTAIEVIHQVNRPGRLFMGSTSPHQRQGILQLGVLTVSGASHHETQVREIAGDIADHFPADLSMTTHGVTVRVTEAPEVGGSFRDDKRARWVTPISIRWETFQ